MLIKMPFEILIEVLFEVLIEVLIDGLMRFRQGCIRRWYVRCTGEFAMFCQKAASDSETVRCTDGFPIISKRLHSDDRMHWRVFDFSRCLDYRYSGEVLTVWRRQVAGRQAKRAAGRQIKRARRQKWDGVCWLLKQASWFAKNDERQWFSRETFRERAKSTVTNSWSWNF